MQEIGNASLKHSQILIKKLSFNNELLNGTKFLRNYPDMVEPCLKPRINFYLVISLSNLFINQSALCIIDSYDRILEIFRKTNCEPSLTGGIRI